MQTKRDLTRIALGGMVSALLAAGCAAGNDNDAVDHRADRLTDAGTVATEKPDTGCATSEQDSGAAADGASSAPAESSGAKADGGAGADSGATGAPAPESGTEADTATPAEDTGSPPSGGDSSPPSGAALIGASFLSSLGKDHLLVGGSMTNDIALEAPFEAQYLYLAGGIFDSPQVCTSCTSDCTSSGVSCAAGACGWWGCWQDTALAPGQFASGFLGTAMTDKQIPVISYYEFLGASGGAQGAAEVAATNNVAVMTRYLADWRFVTQLVGSSVAILHIEPDFWGFAEQVNADPHSIPAAVATANPTDCGSQENSIAGMGRCMIAMARKYAPNAKVGLHASSWGINTAVLLNSNPSYDVAGAAQQVGTFMLAAGAGNGDFIMVDASDRDAGYYTSIGQNTWWDATNATLPNFHQAFAWSKALAEETNLGVFWWQVPVGNMSLPNVTTQWNDNRVDYFFAHTSEVAAAHGVGMLFGAGAAGQTTPSTDNGNLVAKTQSYIASGGQAL
jgi:hypothetical protein